MPQSSQRTSDWTLEPSAQLCQAKSGLQLSLRMLRANLAGNECQLQLQDLPARSPFGIYTQGEQQDWHYKAMPPHAHTH